MEIEVDSILGEQVPQEEGDMPKKAADKKEKPKLKTTAKSASQIKEDVERKKNTAEALKSIQKSLGDRIKVGTQKSYTAIPTGVLILDHLIGLKNSDYRGYPRGRIIEVHGWESTGKTTLMTQACIEAQKLGMTPAYIDFEQAFDETYAVRQGLDVSEDKFLYVRPTCMEDLDEILSKFITAGCEFVVVDSVPAMTPKKILDGETETLALQARYISSYIKKWNALAATHNTCVAFINQMRANIGGMKDSKATGGNSLPFFASVRVELSPLGKESRMVEDDLTGEKEKSSTAILVKATLIKNKVGIPFKSGEFRVVLGEGIDNIHTLRVLGEKKGYITRSGAFYTYTSPFDSTIVVKGQGTFLFDQNFKESPVLFEDLRKAIGL